MTKTEHLERIKQKCLANLALAKKRTPGMWQENPSEVTNLHFVKCSAGNIGQRMWKTDADFIAACAGAAEAGWRSTIAAIEMCAKLRGDGESGGIVARSKIITVGFIETAIIAAWPEELLATGRATV